jgi:hypothetical protein
MTPGPVQDNLVDFNDTFLILINGMPSRAAGSACDSTCSRVTYCLQGRILLRGNPGTRLNTEHDGIQVCGWPATSLVLAAGILFQDAYDMA